MLFRSVSQSRYYEKGYRAPAEEDVIAKMIAKGVPRQKANLYGSPSRDHRKYAENPDRFIGWQPACTCDAGDPVPCVVLDPFGGSGTTAAVAMELGRDAILCELNPEYVPLAIDRIEATIQWIKDGKPSKKPKKAKVIESDFVQPGMLDLEV